MLISQGNEKKKPQIARWRNGAFLLIKIVSEGALFHYPSCESSQTGFVVFSVNEVGNHVLASSYVKLCTFPKPVEESIMAFSLVGNYPFTHIGHSSLALQFLRKTSGTSSLLGAW